MKMFVELPAIYLHKAPVDFRKSISGLSAIVESEMELSPFSGAHVRRKFVDAKTVQEKKKIGRAEVGIKYIQKLYRVERLMNYKPADEHLHAPQTESTAVMSNFKEWLDTQLTQVPPISVLGKAVQYTPNQRPKLQVYLTDGRSISTTTAQSAPSNRS